MNPLRRNLLLAAAVAVMVVGGILAGLVASGPSGTKKAFHHSSTTSSSLPAAGGPAVTTATTRPAPATTVPRTTPRSTARSPLRPVGGSVPAQFAPVSVTFVSPQLGWVLGSAPCPRPVCTSLARTADGGRHWVGIPAPLAPLAGGGAISGPGVGQLVFADSRDGWAYGPALWSTHDGGASWHQLPLPGGATAVTGMAAAGGAVFAVTATGDGAGPPGLLRSPDGTDTFAAVGSGPPSTAPVLAAAGTSAWALGANSLQVMSAAGGPASPLTDPCPANPGGGVISAWSSEQLILTCAQGGGLGSETKQVFVSSNGGRSFSRTASPPAPGDVEATATNGTTLVVAASSGASELYASFDGGHTWTTPYSDASGGAPFSDLGFTTPTEGEAIEGVAGTGPQPFLIVTRDGGHTWAKEPIA